MSDWGTGLSARCLNPELKVERLVAKKELTSPGPIEDVFNDEAKFVDLVKTIRTIGERAKDDDMIQYAEWSNVPNPLSKKGSKMSKKIYHTIEMKKLIINLLKELDVMKDHLHRAHMQYRAFKAARDEAMSNSAVVTIQVYWSVTFLDVFRTSVLDL